MSFSLKNKFSPKKIKKIEKIIDKVFISLYTRKVNRHGGLAQLVEHLPYKQAVIGSSPIVSTTFILAGMAELADALDLGSSSREWGFKSLCPHHNII